MTTGSLLTAGPSAQNAEQVLATLATLVEPLKGALPDDSEIVLHDLRRLPNSIVAIAGDVTGRSVGGPATDLLLRKAAAGTLDTTVGYETRLPDGRSLRSTTIVVRDAQGTAVAALCINCDVMIWQAVKAIAESMLPQESPTEQSSTEQHTEQHADRRTGQDSEPHKARRTGGHSELHQERHAELPDQPEEKFFRDIDDLAQHLLAEAIEACGAPVDLMQKKHKIAVVNDLKGRGFFMLKESVGMAAQALQVTRFTVYNYLNELGNEARGS